MAEGWGTGGLDTRRSEQYGEKIEVLEKQLGEISSLLPSVVMWLVVSREEGSPLCPFCLLYTSPSPRDGLLSRMPSSA